jgi:hypothetical protein
LSQSLKKQKMRIIKQSVDLEGCFKNIQATKYEIIKAYRLLSDVGVDTDESNFLVINGTIEDVAAMLIKAMRNLR